MPHTNHPVSTDRVCRCAACDETFSGITTFDQHRVEGRCVNPAEVGLEIQNRTRGSLWADPRAKEAFKRLDSGSQ